jgi:hypothetical protein
MPAYPEEHLPDRTSEPAEGERRTYALPNEYGPARPPRRGDSLDDARDGFGEPTPTVVLRVRDEPDAHVAVAAGNGDAPRSAPTEEGERASEPASGLSRREIREQRERERAPTKVSTKPARTSRQKWTRRAIAIAIVLLLIPVGVSYVHAIQRPGSDTLSVKTVEWIRDHGGNGIVNTVERWWYTNNPPPTGGKPSAIQVQDTVSQSRPVATTAAPPKYQHLAPPTARVPTPAAQVEPNEGVWNPIGRLVGGQAAIYSAYVRPDAVHTSYYTALLWLDTKLLRANYVVGLEQPGGGPNPWNSQIPATEQPNAIAAFNSGFKMDSARGGAYLDGDEIKGLVGGAASLVIFQDGSSSVGVWGRDFTMGPDIKAVRQNLELIVDGGQLNPALQESDTHAFGDTLGNNVYVWRSGVGVTADGALVYAGGPAMSIIALARTLQSAGAVRAMELDINTDWVSAFAYVPQNATDPNAPTVGVKLLDSMAHDGNQYLQQSSRDFFAFTADPKPEVPVTTTTTRPKKG